LKLDKVMDMSKGAMSNTIALSEGVDLESINKGKCVLVSCVMNPKEFDASCDEGLHE
jgi:hypothetical protein